jgi:hypothetical protein
MHCVREMQVDVQLKDRIGNAEDRYAVGRLLVLKAAGGGGESASAVSGNVPGHKGIERSVFHAVRQESGRPRKVLLIETPSTDPRFMMTRRVPGARQGVIINRYI